MGKMETIDVSSPGPSAGAIGLSSDLSEQDPAAGAEPVFVLGRVAEHRLQNTQNCLESGLVKFTTCRGWPMAVLLGPCHHPWVT